MIIVLALVLFCCLYVISIVLKNFRRSRYLPPGPSGWPLIGNLSDLPSHGKKDWEHWYKFKDAYGPISSITTMGQVIIILNDAAVANEVMEKHSMDTASRPLSVVLGDLTGWDRQVSFQPNIDIVRVERKSILQALGSPKHIETYADQLNFEGKLFLLRLLEDPKRFVSHIRRQTGATILKIAYGYRVEPRGPDTLLDLSDLSAQQVIPAASPGAWAVDTLPVLKYLPSCFPGAHVKRLAYVWKQTLDDLSEKPYSFVLRQIDGGKHRGSYVSRHLDDLGHKPSPLEQRTIKWTAATMYAAGSDTTVITIHTFFLAMLQNPDVQHRAQMEIDKIVGRDRLPEPKDIENLPFVQALISEVLRWHPVAPTGIPHRATTDIACRDYIIPKGSILVPNIWAFTQDPTVYKDPLSFNPSRFLCEETDDGIPHKAPEPNPRQYVFGFGRRVCPGRFLAEATFSLTIMQTLATYKISKVVRDGKEVDIKADFLPGLLSHPVEFEAIIVPRYENVERIVRAVEADNPWASGDSKELEL